MEAGIGGSVIEKCCILLHNAFQLSAGARQEHSLLTSISCEHDLLRVALSKQYIYPLL